ncbi:hypothetical protein KKH56_03080 [bacterium]|nr:hypothetical protein [bacterium]
MNKDKILYREEQQLKMYLMADQQKREYQTVILAALLGNVGKQWLKGAKYDGT